MNWLPTPDMPLARAATVYAEHGTPVFPCRGKIPALPNGFHAASANPEQVARWWRQFPDANIGLPVPERIWVLDVDGAEGRNTRHALERIHGALPDTLEQRTGSGGEHWFFAAPEGFQARQGARLLPGIDTRTHGRGYVLAAPSVHPDTGRRYEWVRGDVMAVAPEWLMALVKKPELPPRREYKPPALPAAMTKRERYAQAVLRGCAEDVAKAGEGSRNDTLNKAWWRVLQFRDVLGEERARQELRSAALSCGLDEREIAQVLR